MIPSSALFDQSTMTRLLEHDRLVQDYRRFLALFEWDLVDQWPTSASKRGRPAHPLSAYLKALLLRIREGLTYSSHLRHFLLPPAMISAALKRQTERTSVTRTPLSTPTG
jgi:hypothetical protein